MKSRLTTYMVLVFLNVVSINVIAQTTTMAMSNTIGEVSYESKDHRSNVYEVVNDRKTIDNNQFQGIIIAATDYYPYGSEIGARSFNGDYKYGFQGQEKDEEAKGKGNSINYKYRMHDARVGRFFAVDPLSAKYPHYSAYQFSGNRVTNSIELEGLEEQEVFDYSERIKNGVTPQEMRRYRAPHAETAHGDSVFVTEIKTDEEGNTSESTYTVDSWGHSENFIGSGVLIVEMNLKENTYKETVTFRNDVRDAATSEKYVVPDSRSEYRKSVEAFELRFEEASFNWITQKMPVISSVYSIIEGIEGKQKNFQGITYNNLSNAESNYKIVKGSFELISGVKRKTGEGALHEFLIDQVKPTTEDIVNEIEKIIKEK